MSETPFDSLQTIRRRRFLNLDSLTSLVFFLFLWFFWGVRYGDYLYEVQENSLFLYDGDYLSRWLQVPEGALCYATAFLMQFFYIPLLGGFILAAITTAGQILLARLTGLKGCARLATFLPGCFFAISTTWPAYYVFIPYNQPIIFSEPLAILASLCCFAIYRIFAEKRWRAFVGAGFVAILYPFTGFWGVFVAALCFAWELANAADARKDRAAQNVALGSAIILALGALLIPILWSQLVFFRTIKTTDIYNRGLLEDIRYDKNTLTARFFYGAVELAPLTIFVLVLVNRIVSLTRKRTSKDSTSSQTLSRQNKRLRQRIAEKEAKKRKQAKDQNLSSVALSEEEIDAKFRREKERARVRLVWELFFILMACVLVASYHTRSFFTVMKASRALVSEDWEELLRVESKDPFPNKSEVQMRNLALFYTGRLTESAFERPIAGLSTAPVTGYDYAKSVSGSFWHKAKVKRYMMMRETELCSDRVLCELLYCYWGQTNIAARIAMNNLMAAEDRSISCLRTLAIAAMTSGEYKLASRYLRLLSGTIFYRDWANAGLAYLESPDFYNGVRDFHNDKAFGERLEELRAERPTASSVEEAARKFRVDPERVANIAATIERIRSLRPTKDYGTTLGYPNLVFLYDIAKEDEYDASPSERRELMLISALMLKKRDFFLDRVEPLLKEKYPNGGAPKALEQGYASWRYQRYGRNKWQDCDYKFTPETIELFNQFADYVEAVQQTTGVNSDEAQETLRTHCRGLYWGYAGDESVFKPY